MSDFRPFKGLLYNPEHVKLSSALAPPYDVINDTQREQLYASDLRNIVRIDAGMALPTDRDRVADRYTRAAAHLRSWLQLGILVPESAPSYVVTSHEFVLPGGEAQRRIGIFGTVAATPWAESEIRPHERTMTGPKVDRLRLMQATTAQTSAVFCMAHGAHDLAALLERVTQTDAYLGGRTQGEFGSEKHLVWRVTDDELVSAIGTAMQQAALYIADGHHRYETAVAYADEARTANPALTDDDPAMRCLIYTALADDPNIAILPTHRMLAPGPHVPQTAADVEALVGEGVDVVAVENLEQAAKAASLRRATHHAYGVALRDGAALVAKRRFDSASPRDALDVCALEAILLQPLGIDSTAIAAGALTYSRDIDDVARKVAGGEAGIGIVVNPVTVAEVIAVADAGEVMPQKSTYFYPKVPTGIVLAPLA